MQWMDILKEIGIFAGGGFLAFLTFLYNARPKKNSIEIDNMKKAMDELQNVINQMSETNRKNHEDSLIYRNETDATIKELKAEMAEMKIRLDIKHEAIYAAEHCDKIEDTSQCIVMRTFKERCKDCLNK